MRVVVTGGAGFVGSHVVDRFEAEGSEVLVIDDFSTGSESNLDSSNAHVVRIGITDMAVAEDVTKFRPDAVCHLAAQSSVGVSIARPVFDAEVNIVGSLNVLEATRHSGAKTFVYAASASLYGDSEALELPISEDSPHSPTSPYGVSKAAVLQYLPVYAQLHSISSSALVLANVYGPRQRVDGEAGVVATFCNQLAAGNASTIYGDGEQTRDYVYVADVADAFYRAATKEPSSGIVNIGTGIETSVNQLHKLVAEACGRDLEAKTAPERPGDIKRSALHPSGAHEVLGWRPTTSLDVGIQNLIDHIRAQN